MNTSEKKRRSSRLVRAESVLSEYLKAFLAFGLGYMDYSLIDSAFQDKGKQAMNNNACLLHNLQQNQSCEVSL